MGQGLDGRRGGTVAFREHLDVEGLIADETRLEFHQAYAHPSGRQGAVSQALSALPDGSARNFFQLGIHNPSFDVEAGEITAAPVQLLSQRELGDGLRVAVRPLAQKDALQVEAFAERNTLTLKSKDVFGVTASGTVKQSPLEF